MKRLSVKDVAKLLKKSEQEVRLLARMGQIPALVVGGNGRNSYFFYEEILKKEGFIK